MHVFVLWEEARVESVSTLNLLAFEIVFLYFTSSDEDAAYQGVSLGILNLLTHRNIGI